MVAHSYLSWSLLTQQCSILLSKRLQALIILYVQRHGHLLCDLDRSLVPYENLDYHLRPCRLHTSFFTTIVSQYESVAVPHTDADVISLPGGFSLLKVPESPKRGCFCPYCDYTSSSWYVLLRHFRRAQLRQERNV